MTRGMKEKRFDARLSLNYTAAVRDELEAVAERYGLPFAQVVRESLAAGVKSVSERLRSQARRANRTEAGN